MRITHICLANFYVDGYSYQENLLPKYHARMGYEVNIIASRQSFNSDGVQCFLNGPDEYTNSDGIIVSRLEYKRPFRVGKRFRRYVGLKECLERFSPDILFIHGVQSSENSLIAKYAEEHPNLQIFADNHADYYNSAKTFLSKNILHKVIWRYYAQKINPYVNTFWGVLPSRVKYLIQCYGLPEDKCKLLPLGADDDEVMRVSDTQHRFAVRHNLGIGEEFLIVSGGKVDQNKPEVLNLINAVTHSNIDCKLLFFGPVIPEMKEEFLKKVKGNSRIIYVQWASASESYDYFSIADLIVFPGKHSVYWEQAAALAKPLLLRSFPGVRHILGEKALYLEDGNIETIQAAINLLYRHRKSMAKQIPAEPERFLYSKIARQSIQTQNN